MAKAVRINLLDWRAERRQRRQQQFGVAAGVSAAAAAAIVLGTLMAVKSQVEYQTQRNDFLKQQIALMDKQIEEIKNLEKTKANLIARMEVIQKLQKTRSDIVHFYDEMVSLLPDGLYLTSIKLQGNRVTLDGVAESNGYISTYLKSLDSSEWFSDARLVVIKTRKDQLRRVADFTITVTAFQKAQGANSTQDEEIQ